MAETETKAKAKFRVTGLRVNEISFVDNPAVPKARFVIEKRKGGGDMAELKTCDACGSEVDLEKQEVTSQHGESAMNFVQRAVGNLMAVRRSLPRPVRELLMALDLAADDVLQNGSDPDTAKGYVERAVEEKARGPEGEKPKKPGPEAAIPGFEDKAKDKGGHQDCPEGMKFDPSEGKCVPMDKEEKEKGVHRPEDKPKEEDKKVEKQEEEVKPEEKSPDPQTGAGGLEFNADQSAGIDKLLGRYPQ